MPINYNNYPPNWKQIRFRILDRAENKCECCGLKNFSILWSFKFQGKTTWSDELPNNRDAFNIPKKVKVILTIAHLDHDETNHDVKDERLKAMCQLCHLRYDSAEKKRRKQAKADNDSIL